MTTIAIIKNTDVTNTALFNEGTKKADLAFARVFLSDGAFGDADDVQILEEGYGIDDYYINNNFIKAKWYAQLDEDGISIANIRKPAMEQSGNDIMALGAGEGMIEGNLIPISGNDYSIIGQKWDGEKFSPLPSEAEVLIEEQRKTQTMLAELLAKMD